MDINPSFGPDKLPGLRQEGFWPGFAVPDLLEGRTLLQAGDVQNVGAATRVSGHLHMAEFVVVILHSFRAQDSKLVSLFRNSSCGNRTDFTNSRKFGRRTYKKNLIA